MLALSCRQIPTESFECSLSQEGFGLFGLFGFSLAAHVCTRAPAMGHSEMPPGPPGCCSCSFVCRVKSCPCGGVSAAVPPRTKLVAVGACRVPWWKSESVHKVTGSFTAEEPQAAAAGSVQVGLETCGIHTALCSAASATCVHPNEDRDALQQARP